MKDGKAAATAITEAEAKELGEAFGGTVVRINTDDADTFFLTHEEEFSLDGRTHYLRLLGIGKALYDNQTDPTRVSILAAQKGVVRAVAEGVYTLRNTENKYFFAALASRLGWEDPREYLDLTEKEGWILSGDDEKRGMLRFTKCVGTEKGEWSPAVFADVPYLYSRPMSLCVGLYNATLNAGMRDTINTSGSFRFKMDEFASDDFRNVAEALAKVAEANGDVYGQFLEALRHKPVLLEDARTMLRNAAAEKRLPRFQTSATLKFFDVLERGGEVDVLAPKTVKTLADVVDALALYGRENAKGSLVSQIRAETGLFTTFFEDIYEADGGELPTYTDLKEHVAQLG